jgi:serine protease inhibitor
MQNEDPTRTKPSVWAALPLMLALSGCGGSGNQSELSQGTDSGLPTAVAAAKASATPVNPIIVSADNGFGLSLLGQLQQASPGENVVISPVSIAVTLQIAYNGAGGAAQQAMAQTLQLGTLATPAGLNDANAALQASLVDADPAVTLTIANSLWMHLAANPVLPAFTQMDQTYYGATIGDLAGAPANVNAWVATATHGLITKVLPDGNYDDVIAVLANAIYFKAQWTDAFNPSLTVSAPFTTGGGNQISVEMMHQSGTYPYLQGPNFQAARLPYGSGRFSMLIVLPDSGTSLATLVASMTPDSLNEWLNQMLPTLGSIALPRFTTTFGAKLNPALTGLGMGPAFCPGELPGIAAGACISYVGHASVVEVDETGTVAAAATVVTTVDTVAQPGFIMTMDQPFFFAVLDDQTHELLFVGVLENPVGS